jgi:hypothetical protein
MLNPFCDAAVAKFTSYVAESFELEDLPSLALAVKIKEKEFLEGKSTLTLIQLEPGVAFILIVLINLVLCRHRTREYYCT